MLAEEEADPQEEEDHSASDKPDMPDMPDMPEAEEESEAKEQVAASELDNGCGGRPEGEEAGSVAESGRARRTVMSM